MAGTNKETTKIRILAIAKMLNEGRCISTSEILRRLDLQYDIHVDRKTIYSDICSIDRFIPICVIAGKNGGYKKYNVMEACDDGQQG